MNRDFIEHNIYLRHDGAIVWESVLEREVAEPDLSRILVLVGVHSLDERIDWYKVWKEFDQGGRYEH